jgi:hypothetical protein
VSATLNTTSNGGYQPVCSEHNWADQVLYDFSLACESVDEHNRERHETHKTHTDSQRAGSHIHQIHPLSPQLGGAMEFTEDELRVIYQALGYYAAHTSRNDDDEARALSHRIFHHLKGDT